MKPKLPSSLKPKTVSSLPARRTAVYLRALQRVKSGVYSQATVNRLRAGGYKGKLSPSKATAADPAQGSSY